MNLLLLLSHSIEEYDQLKLLTDLGYDAFSIGAYTNPAEPGDDKRPPIPNAPYHPELVALCNQQREKHAGESTDQVIDWAKGDLHPDLIDWADAIIIHHFPQPWLIAQWPRLKGKRVIWRTVGQSNPQLEAAMAPLHRQGLQIVRYSPAEKRAFERMGCFAGEDALIRFYKDPAEWYGWTGEDPVVGNITQNMADRGEFCGYAFWLEATKGLPTKPAGPGSEKLPGGIGPLGYDEMREYLRRIGVYLYTGTQPASYTLGLIEAMMTGVPVVSIGPEHMWIPDLFEGHEIAPLIEMKALRMLLENEDFREFESGICQRIAVNLFGVETVGAQWKAFLDGKGVI